MIKKIVSMGYLVAATLVALPASAQLTVEECQSMARQNYPLLKKYDLINQTAGFSIENINKGYLPQVTLSGQASYQSDVATLPDALTNMLEGNGYKVKGLEKDQYRIGIDISQNIWDGGNLSAQKEVAERERDVQTLQTDVDMYELNARVNNLFFGILLIDEKLSLNHDLQTLLKDNCRKIETMVANGTAMKADADVMKAEYLNACQRHTELSSMKRRYQKMLAIFIGKDTETVAVPKKPDATVPATYSNNRPELQLFNTQIRKYDAQKKQLDAGIRPKISLFAQGYYGYPGYDMFNDMFDHDWTLNGIVGISLKWQLGNLYTYKNDKRKLDIAKSQTETAREVFLFNNNLQSVQDTEAIKQYKEMMGEDAAIIDLRKSVRMAAEAKLENGVIDVNNLLQEINRENSARISCSTHEIEMLKSIYELKNTLNQ